MEDNQKVIESLLQVIMVCGMHIHDSQGHRDDKIYFVEPKEQKAENHDNSIEIFHLRS